MSLEKRGIHEIATSIDSHKSLHKKGVRYYGIGSNSELRKIKQWKFVDKAMSLGSELRTIEEYLRKGHVVKVKEIYRASMIYINVG